MTDTPPDTGPSGGGDAPGQPLRRRRWRVAAIAAAALLAAGAAMSLYVGVFSWQLVRGVADDPDRTEPEDAGVEPPRPVPEPDEPLNILVLGLDEGLQEGGRRGARRSDTVMLVTIDPLLDHRVSILSLPRDTRVTMPLERLAPQIRERVWENPTKLAHVHAFGGPAAAMATVADFLGVPVHRYVRLAPDAFEALVDILGGVHICVERDMYRFDPYQDLLIDLKRGCQLLDGRQAAGYARWRGDSDIARIGRQHKLVSALIDRALSLGVIPRLPQLVKEITSRVDTNLSEAEILNLVSVAMRVAGEFETGSLRTGTVPGTNRRVGGIDYWIADPAATRRLVDELVWNLQAPAADPPAVAVVGGGAEPQMLHRYAAYLRSLGYRATVTRLDPGEPVPDARPGSTYILVYDEAHEQAARLLARATTAGGSVPVYAVSRQGRALAAPAGSGGPAGEPDLVVILGTEPLRLVDLRTEDEPQAEPGPAGDAGSAGGSRNRRDLQALIH